MTAGVAERNCIDIVTPFRDGLLEHDFADVQIMGGIGSAALAHEGTVIIPHERSIVTAPDFLEDEGTKVALNRFRGDGTMRDLDVLVLSADPDEIERVEAMAEETIDGQLEVSVFGLHNAAKLKEQVADPFGWQAVKTFVSDRYVWEDGSMEKALFPFAVPLEPDLLETWQVEIGDETFPVANPASTVLNYLTRSVSGLRHKDFDKVQEMAANIFGKAPELAEWAVDGPGQSQMDLAAILQTLRRANSLPFSKRKLDVGGALRIRAGSVRALADHEAFMLPDADADTRDAVLGLTLLKSRGLGIGESQDGIVKIFRNHAEARVDGITKNK